MSAPGTRFEPVGPASFEDLADCFEALRGAEGAEFFHPHPLDRAEAGRRCAYAGRDYYCLAYVGDKPAGYGMLRGWDEGYVEPSLGIALRPEFRGRGLGRALSEHLHAVARARGAATVRLKVYERNAAARALYEKLGYVLTPHAPGELLGRLSLGGPRRIGILVQDLMHWNGGQDLLCALVEALIAAPSAQHTELHVLIPSLPPRRWSRAHFRELRHRLRRRLGLRAPEPLPDLAPLRARLKDLGPRLRITETEVGDLAQAEAARALGLDAAFPVMRPTNLGPRCRTLGYLYDFQHRHLPGFFPPAASRERDRRFRELLTGVPAVIVNARAVEADIRRFVPEATAHVFALPFAPTTHEEWLRPRPELVAHHGLTGPYLILCNQFWAHKDHRTAFRAFAQVAADFPGATLVCTGGMDDDRFPGHVAELRAELARLGIADRVRLLGLLPKREQIELLKGAAALVQPTLCEGGPGGGAAHDALGLDVPVIASDIPVNLEMENLRACFFPVGDAGALAVRMRAALAEPVRRAPDEVLLERSRAAAARRGEVLWRAILAAVRPSVP